MAKFLRRILIACAILFVTVLIINAATSYPRVLSTKTQTNTTTKTVKIGPYSANVATVKTSDIVHIPVSGLPDAKVTLYSQADIVKSSRPLILFIHGGGWTSGSALQVAAYAKLLASNGYLVANLDYSLAPAYTYPTPIVQSLAAIKYLKIHAKEYGADNTKFFIAGNSAGAQIAGELGALLTNPTFAKETGYVIDMPPANLKGLILFNGIYDFSTVRKDNFPGMDYFASSYTGQEDYENYEKINELSTVRNVSANYPNTFLTAGDADPLEVQSYEFGSALRKAGAGVTGVYWSGSNKKLTHDYMYDLNNSASQVVYRKVVQFISDNAR